MSSYNLPELLSRIVGIISYVLPIFLFIVLSIYYISKAGLKTEGLFILIGNILIFIVAITHQFLYIYIDSWGFRLYTIINIGVNAISFIGSLLFLIGFFLLIKRTLSGLKNEN